MYKASQREGEVIFIAPPHGLKVMGSTTCPVFAGRRKAEAHSPSFVSHMLFSSAVRKKGEDRKTVCTVTLAVPVNTERQPHCKRIRRAK